MASTKTILITFFLLLGSVMLVFAEDATFFMHVQMPSFQGPSRSKNDMQGIKISSDLYDERTALLDVKSQEEELREEWEYFLRLDIFGPYYKARQIKTWFQGKTNVTFLDFHGRAELELDKAQYVFKLKF